VVEEKPVKAEGEEEERPTDEPPAEETAKPKFRPQDYKWTKSNGMPKNLPQLFRDFKGNPIDDQTNADEYPASSQHESVGMALEAFCDKIVQDSGARNYFR
jgi:hypothetical protein